MDDERIHMACLLTETGDAISALLGSAKFELKQWLVSRADNAEVVGHVASLRTGNSTSGLDQKRAGPLP